MSASKLPLFIQNKHVLILTSKFPFEATAVLVHWGITFNQLQPDNKGCCYSRWYGWLVVLHVLCFLSGPVLSCLVVQPCKVLSSHIVTFPGNIQSSIAMCNYGQPVTATNSHIQQGSSSKIQPCPVIASQFQLRPASMVCSARSSQIVQFMPQMSGQSGPLKFNYGQRRSSIVSQPHASMVLWHANKIFASSDGQPSSQHNNSTKAI